MYYTSIREISHFNLNYLYTSTKIVERGTHAELMEHKGFYYDMQKAQEVAVLVEA